MSPVGGHVTRQVLALALVQVLVLALTLTLALVLAWVRWVRRPRC